MLTLVPTPIGNLQDISQRALFALTNAQILLCEDTRVAKRLLFLLKEKQNLETNIDKFISLHSHNEKEWLKNIEPDFFQQNIVYISDAGMPSISDPGALLVGYCKDNNIEYDVLPGANALLTAFAASGFIENSFVFLGFLPHKGHDRDVALQEALYNSYTTILYESPHRLLKLLEQLNQIEPKRVIFLAKELTKMHQKYYKDSATNLYHLLKNENIKGEWVVVIEATTSSKLTITQEDILALKLPKKQSAKLISRLTGESTKDCYDRLINQ